MRAANVLLIGVRALGSEIAKNILLSGINSLTILDDAVVTEEEQIKNFLLPPESTGKKVGTHYAYVNSIDILVNFIFKNKLLCL